MKLSQSKCNICPTTPHPHRKLLARQSLPAGGPRGQCLLPQPHPSCLSLGDQPLGEAPGSLGPPAITAREPLGSVGLLSPGEGPCGSECPSCSAASHAKDNSNSPLGLSQGPQP